MTDRITIAAYRTHAENRTQIVLSQTDERGRGHGYRIAGPKHYNSGVTELIASDLTARDAAEIRAMLDAVFPVDQSQHRDQVLTEAADRQRAIAGRLPEHLAAAAPLLSALADVIDPRCRKLFQPARVRDAAADLLLAARTGQEG